jgi:hypothetical protein
MLSIYLAFALSVTIMAWITAIIPIMIQLEELRPSHILVDRKYTTYIVLLTLVFIAAPLMFVPTVLSVTRRKIFIASTLRSLLDEKKST